jgi:hypothetical protein
MITVASLVRRLRVDLERPDAFWPAQLAALVSIVLYVTLPDKLTIGPSWSAPLLEAVLFVALVLATPGKRCPAPGCVSGSLSR